MCNCDIICYCQTDTPPVSVALGTLGDASVGAWLLGKTRPPVPSNGTVEQLNLFNILSDYRSYAYTLSPKGIGLLSGKSRDNQYKVLKRIHNEVLSNFECSYFINIEVYPGDDNHLHCHGLIRFRSHSKKEEFKKLLKDKLTMYRKGTYPNLIDCEFVNSFEHWSGYIMKDQERIVSFGYLPFVKIDYSFHILNSQSIVPVSVPVADKTRLKKQKNLEDQLLKAQNRVNKLLSQISLLKNI